MHMLLCIPSNTLSALLCLQSHLPNTGVIIPVHKQCLMLTFAEAVPELCLLLSNPSTLSYILDKMKPAQLKLPVPVILLRSPPYKSLCDSTVHLLISTEPAEIPPDNVAFGVASLRQRTGELCISRLVVTKMH